MKKNYKESAKLLLELDNQVLNNIQSSLKKIIKDKTGLSVRLAINIKDGKYLEINSNDVISELKVKGLFKHLFIKNFGGSIKDNEIWIPISWSWVHFGGGTNSTRIFDAVFDNTGKLISER